MYCEARRFSLFLACVILMVLAVRGAAQESPLGLAGGVTKLVPCASGNDVRFGDSVAKYKDVIAVGAPNHDVLNRVPGSVCLFESTMVSCCTLSGDLNRPLFGIRIAIEGDLLVVDDTRSIYLYVRRASHVWEQVRIFDFESISGFAISEGRIAVSVVIGRRIALLEVDEDGGWYESDSIDLPPSSDSYRVALGKSVLLATELTDVLVYEETSRGWQHTATIESPEVDADGGFGFALAVQRGRAYVGNPRLKNQDVGVVYVFRRSTPSSWTLVERLAPRNGQVLEGFGEAIDFGPDGLFVAAPGYDARWGEDQGAVYRYERTGPDDWRFVERRINPAKKDEFAKFGSAVASDRGVLVVGAPAPFGASFGLSPQVYLISVSD